MRHVVQVKGANGSGKTTIARQLIALEVNSSVYTVKLKGLNNEKPIATILPNLKWAIMGTYPAGGKSGGCDIINRMDWLLPGISEIADLFPDFWILAEGAMISTTMTTYNYLVNCNLNPLVVILNTDMEHCLRRLEKRKGDGVKLTADMFTQLAPKLDRIPKQKHQPEHARQMYVDQLAEEDMVYEFLSVIGWHPQP